jgi:hypothetical protein
LGERHEGEEFHAKTRRKKRRKKEKQKELKEKILRKMLFFFAAPSSFA